MFSQMYIFLNNAFVNIQQFISVILNFTTTYHEHGYKSGFFIGEDGDMGIIGQVLPKFAISRVWGYDFVVSINRF